MTALKTELRLRYISLLGSPIASGRFSIAYFQLLQHLPIFIVTIGFPQEENGDSPKRLVDCGFIYLLPAVGRKSHEIQIWWQKISRTVDKSVSALYNLFQIPHLIPSIKQSFIWVKLSYPEYFFITPSSQGQTTVNLAEGPCLRRLLAARSKMSQVALVVVAVPGGLLS